MKSTFAILALVSTSAAVKLVHRTREWAEVQTAAAHACDFIDDNGEEISTSLMPEYVQLGDNTDDAAQEVAKEKEKWAQMQAQMDAAVAEADAKRAEQQNQYEQNIQNGDPAAQLQGLMNAQQSLKRISSAFQAKPKQDKVQEMAQKLGIPMTPELMQLGSNEAISNALVEIAVGMGKTEEEISAALGSD